MQYYNPNVENHGAFCHENNIEERFQNSFYNSWIPKSGMTTKLK